MRQALSYLKKGRGGKRGEREGREGERGGEGGGRGERGGRKRGERGERGEERGVRVSPHTGKSEQPQVHKKVCVLVCLYHGTNT